VIYFGYAGIARRDALLSFHFCGKGVMSDQVMCFTNNALVSTYRYMDIKGFGMASRKRRSWSNENKRTICQQTIASGVSATQVSKLLNHPCQWPRNMRSPSRPLTAPYRNHHRTRPVRHPCPYGSSMPITLENCTLQYFECSL
jgi:hypothetical protein